MTHPVSPQFAAWKAAVALWLTCVAGAVDAIGYLVLRELYVANMSGNTVSFSRALGFHRWQEALIRISPLVAFVAGLIVTGVWLEVSRVRRWRRGPALVLALELILLALFGWIAVKDASGPRFIALVFLAAGAMGLQNAALSRVAGLSFRTTHVTGTLAHFGQALSRYLVRRRRASPDRRARWRRAIGFYAALWLIYAVGAVAGALLALPFGPKSMLAPAAGVGLAVIVELGWPTPAP